MPVETDVRLRRWGAKRRDERDDGGAETDAADEGDRNEKPRERGWDSWKIMGAPGAILRSVDGVNDEHT